MGSQEDIEEVKQHPWFKDIDWKALQNQLLKPPYDPHVTDKNWIQNFDEEFLRQDCSLLTHSSQGFRHF